MIHWILHLLHCNYTVYETWWIQTSNGKKLMGGRRCQHCGKLEDIRPVGFEVTLTL